MKAIFHKPIGTLRSLGVTPFWIKEAACLLLCALLFVLALICL